MLYIPHIFLYIPHSALFSTLQLYGKYSTLFLFDLPMQNTLYNLIAFFDVHTFDLANYVCTRAHVCVSVFVCVCEPA